MSRIRGRDTTPERYLAAMLKAAGVQFTSHDANIAGRPDFVLHEVGVVVFVDGDFWHGWRFPVWQQKLSAKWRLKIAGNRARDVRNHRKLRTLGWRVIRIWEHQVEQDAWRCFERIVASLDLSRSNRAAARTALSELPKLKYRNRLPRMRQAKSRNDLQA